MSGSTAWSISGSSSSRCRSSLSMASRCITCTTPDGKYFRMSPSHRTTAGADADSPPARLERRPGLVAGGGESYSALSAASIRLSSPRNSMPVPSGWC
jgi:hypothetical protein